MGDELGRLALAAGAEAAADPHLGAAPGSPPPYLASALLEIRKSARERRDEAEAILEDSVEWHDRHRFLLGQTWHQAGFVGGGFLFCF